MKRILNRRTHLTGPIATALAYSVVLIVILSLAGCAENDAVDAEPREEEVKVDFSMATRSELPNAGTEFLKTGTTVKVGVLKKNTVPTENLFVIQGNYRVITDNKVIPLTQADQIRLPKGEYDFYFISPATDVTNGVASVGNGIDFMVGTVKGKEIQQETAGYCTVEAAMTRLCSCLEFKISAKEGAYIHTMVPAENAGTVTGLPESGKFTLGTDALTDISGTEGKTGINADRFDTSGTGTQTIITTKSGEGIAVLPNATQPTVHINLLINGNPVTVETQITTELVAGYKYLIDITVDKEGSPAFTVSTAPWIKGEDINCDNETEQVATIGAYRDGGVVFWVDADNRKHYKVVSPDETTATWGDARTWATNYGTDWRLPTRTELAEIYGGRHTNGGDTDLTNSVIDRKMTSLGGTAFGAGLYWSSEEVTSGGTHAYAANVTSGSSSGTSTAKTTGLAVRAVKEHQSPEN